MSDSSIKFTANRPTWPATVVALFHNYHHDRLCYNRRTLLSSATKTPMTSLVSRRSFFCSEKKICISISFSKICTKIVVVYRRSAFVSFDHVGQFSPEPIQFVLRINSNAVLYTVVECLHICRPLGPTRTSAWVAADCCAGLANEAAQ